MMYQQIVSQQTGQIVDLRSDIKRYGETAFMHGFNQTFLGNKGHNEKYSEEVISYIDGNTRINDKGSKDRAHKWGTIAAKGAEGASAFGAGGIAGLGLLGLLKTLPFKINCPKAKYFFWGGALATLLGDIMWQKSRSNA